MYHISKSYRNTQTQHFHSVECCATAQTHFCSLSHFDVLWTECTWLSLQRNAGLWIMFHAFTEVEGSSFYSTSFEALETGSEKEVNEREQLRLLLKAVKVSAMTMEFNISTFFCGNFFFSFFSEEKTRLLQYQYMNFQVKFLFSIFNEKLLSSNGRIFIDKTYFTTFRV